VFLCDYNTITLRRTHIRNAVYIALYPLPSTDDEPVISQMNAIPSSPSKFNTRHQRAPHTSSSSASEVAQRLLKAYAQTNSAGSLLRALPRYNCSDIPELTESLPKPPDIDDDGDSDITKASRQVRDSKNCWEILREDFVKREDQSVESSTSRTMTLRKRYSDDVSDGESCSDVPSVVGPHAWPVLEWLLMLFEKDEATSDVSGQRKSAIHLGRTSLTISSARYSPLLLSQIPSSRLGSSSRWDIEAPLDVAFHALRQPGRTTLAARLLSLVCNPCFCPRRRS
jgi:hypothetical protein